MQINGHQPHKARVMVLSKSVWTHTLSIVVCTLLFFSISYTEKGWSRNFDQSRVIEVSLGGSTIINISARKVTLTDPSIAEITKPSDSLLLIGRKVGETNLVAITENGDSDTYLIKVSLPALAIQSELKSLFPNERDVRAKAVGGALVLEGTVSTIQVINQMEEVAKGYLLSPSIVSLGVKPNVINLLTVRSPQQVQIDVSFAEVNRSSLRQIGSLFNVGKGTQFKFSSNSGLSGATGSSFGEIFINPDIGSLPVPLNTTLQLLTEHALSRTLAKPTLVAMSGEKASFLAGGEQPIPIVSGLGQPSVEFKKFGIQLDFSPIVLGDRTIELNTTMSVSVLDQSQGLQIAGTDVPLFRTRSSGTTVRLQHGQSFAIAGLLQDQLENIKRGIPGIGDIPIIGMLFNSREFQRNETELVVVITARLINPVNGADMPPLPGKESFDPNDIGVFFMNVFEETKPVSVPMRGGQANLTDAPKNIADASLTENNQIFGTVGYWR